MKPEIMTTSGKYFNFEDPDPASFDINDIAYALSNTCRYGGHCRPYYSVAQHCDYVSKLVPEEYALHGLLHDAQEAFMGDMPSPLKQMLPEFKIIEDRVEEVILEKYGVVATPEAKRIVKEADLIALRSEREVLLPEGEEGDAWWWVVEEGIPISTREIKPLDQAAARAQFLFRFWQLTRTEEHLGCGDV